MEMEGRIAIQSPFQAKDLQSSVKRFVAAGANPDEAVELANRGGDIAAAVGGNADMMERFSLAIGKIQAGEEGIKNAIKSMEDGINAVGHWYPSY
jgi:hypothetical protein